MIPKKKVTYFLAPLGADWSPIQTEKLQFFCTLNISNQQRRISIKSTMMENTSYIKMCVIPSRTPNKTHGKMKVLHLKKTLKYGFLKAKNAGKV